MLDDWSQCGPVTKALKYQLGIRSVSYLGGQMPLDTFPFFSLAASEILREIYLTDNMASAWL